jgi:hypothetical protein
MWYRTELKLNSVASVHVWTIPTERPPLVDEVSANFWGQRVSRGQRNRSLRPYSPFSRSEPLLFHASSSSVVLTRLSVPRSRATTFQKVFLSNDTMTVRNVESLRIYKLWHKLKFRTLSRRRSYEISQIQVNAFECTKLFVKYLETVFKATVLSLNNFDLGIPTGKTVA